MQPSSETYGAAPGPATAVHAVAAAAAAHGSWTDNSSNNQPKSEPKSASATVEHQVVGGYRVGGTVDIDPKPLYNVGQTVCLLQYVW